MALRSAALQLQLQPLINLPPAYLHPSDKKRTISVNANSSIANALPTVRSLPRRLLLLVGFAPILSNVIPVLAAPIPPMEEPEIIRTQNEEASRWYKDSSYGNTLRFVSSMSDVVDGEGPAADEGDVVVFNYVCRRSNGYFVYSTVDQFTGEAMPVTLPLDEKQIIKGLKDVIVGMKVGGKRRALIPPSLGYINDNLKPTPDEFGPRRSLLSHANEPLVFEVQLLKIV